ncbi:MAG: polysaccharide biosynthesis protein [Clostridiales bacterium]|jgi:stage V sporulation protein B|nr:polysaccharide biosynthesis protein [Clostridiales bacterium]
MKKGLLDKKSMAAGALILGGAGLIAKVLGAVYRIPLTYILGAEGMGVYQLVFPLYALLLTISSAGLPAAVSRLVAERQTLGDRDGARKTLGIALASLAGFGLALSVLVFLLARPIAAAQGNPAAAPAYRAVAPSVLFVGVLCALRGYFQGKHTMVPTAISQLVEQAVKLAAGLALAHALLPRGLEYGVLGATLGVTLSEAAALGVLTVQYFAERDRLRPLLRGGAWASFKTLYALSIPVTLGAVILPLVQLVDSVMVINLLRRAGESVQTATALYGLANGPVHSLINMPVVLSQAIAAAAIPGIAALRVKGDRAGVEKNASLALKLCLLVALPGAVGLLILAAPILDLLYGGSLKATAALDEFAVGVRLLQLLAPGVLLVAVIQVGTSLLQGLGHSYLPVLALGAGAALKITLSFLLLPVMGIYGSAVSTLACFGLAAALDLFFVLRKVRPQRDLKGLVLAPVASTALMSAAAFLLYRLCERLAHGKIAAVIAILAAGVVYVCALVCLQGELMSTFLRRRGKRRGHTER